MRRFRFCASLLAVFVLAVFVLTGCGGSGAGVDGALRPLVVSAVQSSTKAAETAKTSFVIRMNMSGVPDEPDQSFEVRAEGAVDLTNERARFVMQLPEGFDDGATPITGEVEMIIDGDVGYMRLPEGQSPDGKSWVRMPMEGGFNAGGGGLGMFGSVFDPDLGLDVLGFGEPTNVETVGREDVRGDSTIHYRVTVTPAQDDEDASAALFQMLFAGGSPFVYDVWVDDDDRLRKMTFSVDLAVMLRGMFEAFGGMAAEMGGDDAPDQFPSDMTMLMETESEIWGFGEPVDIEPPPADQVSDHSIVDL